MREGAATAATTMAINNVARNCFMDFSLLSLLNSQPETKPLELERDAAGGPQP